MHAPSLNVQTLVGEMPFGDPNDGGCSIAVDETAQMLYVGGDYVGNESFIYKLSAGGPTVMPTLVDTLILDNVGPRVSRPCRSLVLGGAAEQNKSPWPRTSFLSDPLFNLSLTPPQPKTGCGWLWPLRHGIGHTEWLRYNTYFVIMLWCYICLCWCTRLTREPGTSTGYAGSGDAPFSIVKFSLGTGNGKEWRNNLLPLENRPL